MADTDLTGADVVLLMLAAPTRVASATNRIAGITRLEKLLYLADKEAQVQDGVKERLRFVPYHYGPYSKAVYEAVELLEEADLLREERALDGVTLDAAEERATDAIEGDRVERRFYLTDNGEAVARLLAQQHPDEMRKLGEIKDSYAGMSLRQLIRYVYTKFPEDTVNSRIRDQVL